jgi:small subunit ribosomal protein S6
MYILASSVSDDQIPDVTGQIAQFVSDFGGTDIQETQLGKKKLAYPIKKTRNGFYGLIDFSLEGPKINDLDAKIRTQNTIIRYILVNQDEHLERLSRDREVQAKMNRNRPVEAQSEAGSTAEVPSAPVVPKAAAESTGEVVDLDEQIEAALNEDVSK